MDWKMASEGIDTLAHVCDLAEHIFCYSKADTTESYGDIQHIFVDAECVGVFYGVLRGFSFSLRVCETGLPIKETTAYGISCLASGILG
jgi:hypothetical protein